MKWKLMNATRMRAIAAVLVAVFAALLPVYVMAPNVNLAIRTIALSAALVLFGRSLAIISRPAPRRHGIKSPLASILIHTGIAITIVCSSLVTATFVSHLAWIVQGLLALVMVVPACAVVGQAMFRLGLAIAPNSLSQPTGQVPVRSEWPAVAVVLAVRNEPVDVVVMTLRSALDSVYPTEQLRVVVVDNSSVDGDNIERLEHAVSHACREVQTRFVHRDGTAGFKPRNLDIAMEYVDAQYSLFLDADSTLAPNSLAVAVDKMENDSDIGFVQMQTESMNASSSFFASAAAPFISLMRAGVDLLSQGGGFLFFYGHNAVWRTSAVRECGPWEQYSGDQIMIGEDRTLSIAAHVKGIHGATIQERAGEWVPMSVGEYRTTYQRWSKAFLQSFVRDLPGLLRSRNATVRVKIDEGGRQMFIVSSILMPLLPVIAWTSSGSFVETGYLSVFLFLQTMTAIAIYRRSPRDAPGGRFRAAVLGGFLLTAYTGWVSSTAVIQFVTRNQQGWKPTAKTTDSDPGVLTALREHLGMVSMSVLTIVVTIFVGVSWASDGLVVSEAIDFVLCCTYAVSLLTFLIVFGRRRSSSS